MVRPQSIGILCFSMLLYIVRRKGRVPLRLVAVCLIAVWWQKSHPSLSIGLVAIGSLAIAGWLKKLLHWDQKVPWFLTSATMVVALAQLATPLGWRIFEVSATNLQVSRDWLQISEWMMP